MYEVQMVDKVTAADAKATSAPVTHESGLALVDTHSRNAGTDFHPDWLDSVRVNLSAVERRVASLGGRRTVKKQWQAAWLLRAISFIDLTSLAGDDTPGRIKRLCAKARNPLRDDSDRAGRLGVVHVTARLCGDDRFFVHTGQAGGRVVKVGKIGRLHRPAVNLSRFVQGKNSLILAAFSRTLLELDFS